VPQFLMWFSHTEPWELGGSRFAYQKQQRQTTCGIKAARLGVGFDEGGCSGAPLVQAWVREASCGASGSSCADSKGAAARFRARGGGSSVGSIYRGRL
jgi:hypothetical protein